MRLISLSLLAQQERSLFVYFLFLPSSLLTNIFPSCHLHDALLWSTPCTLAEVERTFSLRTRTVVGAGPADILSSTPEGLKGLKNLKTLKTLDTLDALDASDTSDTVNTLDTLDTRFLG